MNKKKYLAKNTRTVEGNTWALCCLLGLVVYASRASRKIRVIIHKQYQRMLIQHLNLQPSESSYGTRKGQGGRGKAQGGGGKGEGGGVR